MTSKKLSSIELPNHEVSDTTDADSRNAVGEQIKLPVEIASALPYYN